MEDRGRKRLSKARQTQGGSEGSEREKPEAASHHDSQKPFKSSTLPFVSLNVTERKHNTVTL